MGRGKKRTAPSPAVAMSAMAARQGSQRTLRSKIGRNPSKNFLPYQEREIFEYADMVASEEHRDLIEFKIRADTGKVTSVQFTDDKSYTDMRGGVWIRDYSPEAAGERKVPKPDGSFETLKLPTQMDPVDRAICIEGNAEHEGLHCRITDPVVFEAFKKDAEKKRKEAGPKVMAAVEAHQKTLDAYKDQQPTPAQEKAEKKAKSELEATLAASMEPDRIHRIWNAVEDGMIESWSRDHDGPRYSYLYGLAKLDPVVRAEDLEADQKFPAPKEGYHPVDARGKKLKKEQDGSYSAPAKTKVSVWGDTPLGLPAQMDAALLTTALPQYRPGKLHPKVKKCLDECRPYIKAAVSGNTADCCDAAYNIYAILKKHDLLPEVKLGEGGMSMIMMPGGMPMPGSMGMPISAPAGMQFAMDPGEGSGGSGQGQKPKNPMPATDGKPGMGKELSDQLDGSGSGSGDKEGEDGEEKDGKGGGKAGKDKKDGEDADGKDKGKDGKDGDEKSEDKGTDGTDGDADGSTGGTPYSPGAAGGTGGYRPEDDIPIHADKEAEQALQEVRDSLKNQLDDMAGQAQQTAAAEQRAQGTGGVKWKTPPHQKLYRKEEMRKDSIAKALQDEQGKFAFAGKKLAQQFRRIKDVFEEDQTGLRFGRLDRRMITKAVAGNPYVMKRVKIEEAGEIYVDVIFDLSGSTCGDRADQYRAGMMFGIAGQQARIPVSIYGGDESHFEFKRPDDKDLSGMSAIFQVGNGGTPTQNWIEFGRARSALQDARHKWMFIVTDGASNDKQATRQQILAANKEGVAVFGLTYGCSKSDMDQQFGAGNWAMIDDYPQAPKIAWKLIERALKRKLGV